jgi:hypothetical protein
MESRGYDVEIKKFCVSWLDITPNETRVQGSQSVGTFPMLDHVTIIKDDQSRLHM